MINPKICYRGPASIVPGIEDYATARLSGGIYDQDRRLIIESLRDHDYFLHAPPEDLPSPFASEELIPEAIFAGHWFFHFGHFMLETLPMLGLTAQIPENIPILFFPIGFHLLGRRDFNESQLEFCKQLGVDLKRIKLINKHARVTSLKVLEKPYKLNSRYSSSSVDFFKNSLKRNQSHASITRKGVYLTRRSLLPSAERFCVNEFQLEEYYRIKGYTVIAPEDMPISKQLQIAGSSPTLVALDGSALYLSIACNKAAVKCFACRDIVSIKLFIDACGHSYNQTAVSEDATRSGLYIVSADNVSEIDGDDFDGALWNKAYCPIEEERELSLWQAVKDLSAGENIQVRARLLPRLQELGTRASIIVAMSWKDNDDPVEAREFLEQSFTHSPCCWDVARVWLKFLLRTGEIRKAEQVLRLPQFSVDSEWLDFARQVESSGGERLLSEEAALSLVDSFPPNVSIYHYCAQRLRELGHSEMASDLADAGRHSTGIFWIE